MVRSFLLSAGFIAITAATPLAAQGFAGAYLAARQAAVNSDYDAASGYFVSALMRDPRNLELMDGTVLNFLSLGQIDKAFPIAQEMDEVGARSQVAYLALTAGRAAAEDYEALLVADDETGGIGQWVDGLVKAWAQVGNGDMTAALETFDELGKEPGIQGFVNYHKALALASVGDYEGAEAIFNSAAIGTAGQTRRGIMARAEILSQLDQDEEAIALLNDSFGEGSDPELALLLNALENGDAIPFTHIPSAKAGIAEVFFTFAAILRSEAAEEQFVLIYARIARYLRPDHVDALLLSAEVLENLGQYDLAIEEFKAVPSSNPAYHAAELGRAAALRRSDRQAQAIEVLEQLARSHGDLPSVHSALGDALRAQERYEAAITAYDRALELTPEEHRARWVLLYSRGIAEERSGDNEASERDFRAALDLNPDQPQVLNYLGYSMVEQGRNLDEALEMIERAVSVSQNSGYIVDSLGWVLYRLGRYEEAVEQMERAVELTAIDPVINDHLGDVYWAVGRTREAEFQWRRALSFVGADASDTEADPDRIRRKLEVGLDKVLAEEGAAPLHKVAADQ